MFAGVRGISMELKIVCQCGQKYKFDVEPVGGKMPFTVNCPVCQLDGTATANVLLAQALSAPPQLLRPNPPAAIPASPPPTFSPPPPAPVPGGLKINRPAHSAPAPVVQPPATAPANGDPPPPAIGSMRPFEVAAAKHPAKKPSFALGLLGGFIGALAGAAVYFLIFKFTGLRLKILAVGVGALAGWFADFLGKGEGSKELGGITAVLVLAGIVGAQYFVALSWWHDLAATESGIVQSAVNDSLAEAKAVVQAVPTGSDVEIREYLARQSETAGVKLNPADFSADDVKEFRDNQLPIYQKMASGQITNGLFGKGSDVTTPPARDEPDTDENTFKGVFLLLLLSKTNLFSLAAAAAVAFKLSTNA
jgi:hypothetical protein